jgi:hypothetical protein
MYHYLLELALWIFLAFFIGCFLGALARMWFGAAPEKFVVPVAAGELPPAKHAPAESVPPNTAALAKVRPAAPAKKKPAMPATKRSATAAKKK